MSDIQALARECGAVSYTPRPMRAAPHDEADHCVDVNKMVSALRFALEAADVPPAYQPAIVDVFERMCADHFAGVSKLVSPAAPAPCAISRALSKAQIERLYANTDRKLLAGMPRAHFERFVRFFESVYQVSGHKEMP